MFLTDEEAKQAPGLFPEVAAKLDELIARKAARRYDLSDEAIASLARGYPAGAAQELIDANHQPGYTPEQLAEAREKIAKHVRLGAYSNQRESPQRFPDLAAEQMRLFNIDWEHDEKEELRVRWEHQGLRVYAATHFDRKGPARIKSVRLNFTPEEWVGLLNKEGEFLPMCCGNISDVRDHLMGCIREDCYIDVEDLQHVAFLLRDHDNCEQLPPGHPVGELVKLWDKIKDEADSMAGPSSPVMRDFNDVEDAITVVHHATRYLDYRDLFDHDAKPKRKEYTTQKAYKDALRHRAETVLRKKVNTGVAIARLLPAMQTLIREVMRLYPGPIEAHAIIDDKGKVAETRVDLAIWQTRERCQEVLDSWFKDDKEGQLAKFTVKPIRVSVEKGLEILDG